ncbi:hypothetical protein D3C76_1213380 [compost metagenome]
MEVQHRGHQITRVQRNSFSRLQIYFQAIIVLHTFDACFQSWNIIIFTCDMVSTTEVDPFHLWQPLSEFLDHCIQRSLQIVGVLLTQCVEVQSGDAFQQVCIEILQFRAKTRTRRTRIVDLMSFLGRTFRVDAQADLTASLKRLILEFCKL